MSGAYAGTIPAEILPLDSEEERAIVETLLIELNEKFCVSLDPNPSLDRSIPPPPTAHNTGRTVFIGRSNLGRIAKAAADNGHIVVDLTVKGWIPKSGKIDRLCETLKKLNLTEIDTVVIDSMSNTAYLGTDEDGLPIPAGEIRQDQHLGRRRGAPHLQCHQSGGHEDDGVHRQRRRVRRASQQEGEAGIRETGAVHAPTHCKGHTAGPAAAAQAGTAPVMAVWPAAGEPARQFPTARPAARRMGRPKYERRPTGICEDGPPPGEGPEAVSEAATQAAGADG
jgi:hypothetical protein